MRIPRIFLDKTLESGCETELDQRAFQHVIKVLRLREDDQVILFNGSDYEFPATISSVTKKQAILKIHQQRNSESESPLSIHLALGISKGDRMDVAIQKAVELGVKKITPLYTSRCVVNLDSKREIKKMEHWQGIIISACEQCGRVKIPRLEQAISFTSWINHSVHTGFVLDPNAEKSLKEFSSFQKETTVLIGPEGGLDDTEIQLAVTNNFKAVRFGPRILRTETAAIAAITALQVLQGDLLI